MFKASMFYGRKGITICAISVVDLALWDSLGIKGGANLGNDWWESER